MSDGSRPPANLDALPQAAGVIEIKVTLEHHAFVMFKSSLLPIADAIEDPTIQEIMINRANEVWIERGGEIDRLVWVKRDGAVQRIVVDDGNEVIETDGETEWLSSISPDGTRRRERLARAIDDIDVRRAVKALAAANNKNVGLVLDCRMPGYRIAAALPPVAIRGSAICIRKHALSQRKLETYVQDGGFGPLPILKERPMERPDDDAVAAGGEATAEFLRWMVRDRKNIVIAGSTSSGKTTFLNALLTEVPHDQRVLTIEDTAELRVQTPNYVGLEAIPDKDITVRSLVRLALRFRPDRIIVGEVRGPETYDLLDAMNTGHSGGACSLHANSPESALTRIESLVRMNEAADNMPHTVLREQIASTFDFVVFCSRKGHRRGPEQIIEVLGVDPEGRYRTKTLFDARRLPT